MRGLHNYHVSGTLTQRRDEDRWTRTLPPIRVRAKSSLNAIYEVAKVIWAGNGELLDVNDDVVAFVTLAAVEERRVWLRPADCAEYVVDLRTMKVRPPRLVT